MRQPSLGPRFRQPLTKQTKNKWIQITNNSVAPIGDLYLDQGPNAASPRPNCRVIVGLPGHVQKQQQHTDYA